MGPGRLVVVLRNPRAEDLRPAAPSAPGVARHGVRHGDHVASRSSLACFFVLAGRVDGRMEVTAQVDGVLEVNLFPPVSRAPSICPTNGTGGALAGRVDPRLSFTSRLEGEFDGQ